MLRCLIDEEFYNSSEIETQVKKIDPKLSKEDSSTMAPFPKDKNAPTKTFETNLNKHHKTLKLPFMSLLKEKNTMSESSQSINQKDSNRISIYPNDSKMGSFIATDLQKEQNEIKILNEQKAQILPQNNQNEKYFPKTESLKRALENKINNFKLFVSPKNSNVKESLLEEGQSINHFPNFQDFQSLSYRNSRETSSRKSLFRVTNLGSRKSSRETSRDNEKIGKEGKNVKLEKNAINVIYFDKFFNFFRIYFKKHLETENYFLNYYKSIPMMTLFV